MLEDLEDGRLVRLDRKFESIVLMPCNWPHPIVGEDKWRDWHLSSCVEEGCKKPSTRRLLFQNPPQYLLGDLLGLTARFLRRSHTRRAAFLARADVDRLQAVLEEILQQFEKGGAQADAAGIVVVDEDVGLEVGLDEDRILVDSGDTRKEIARRHGLSRQVVADRNADGVLADFGTLGLWLWNGGAWSQISVHNLD